ncbi:MAG: hypothetical protein OXE84_04410 [Rhodobacteraceae bacterium]|nr:hypothetical protein [Paracoccaceae bacterium]MCY4195692.1 hypothetical protein [Paracoccaceae bacterium]
MNSLVIKTATIPDPESFRCPPLADCITYRLNAIFAATEYRCVSLGIEPSVEELMLQLRIRVLQLNDNSGNAQIQSMRKCLGNLLEANKTALERGVWLSVDRIAPPGIDIPDWMRDNWHAIEKAAVLCRSESLGHMRKRAAPELTRLIADSVAAGEFHADADIAVELAGIGKSFLGSNLRRRPQRRWKPFERDDLHLLLNQLPQSRFEFPFLAILAGQFSDPGITRLLTTASWLTGLRFSEIFNFKLVQPKSEADLTSCLENPLTAFREGKLQSLLSAETGHVSYRAIGHHDRIVIMIVETAKSKLASKKIDNRQRALILRFISEDDLDILMKASCLRLFDLNKRQLKSIGRSMCDHLNRTSIDVFPDRPAPVNHHLMRHAFADAAKRCMSLSDAAALTGHTARTSILGYGKRRRQAKTGLRPNRWLPQPDPARAAAIEAVFRAKPCPYADFAPSPDVPEPNPDEPGFQ